MASSSLVLPSISLNHQHHDSVLLKSSVSFGGFKHGFRNSVKSRVSMSLSVGSTTVVDDALFADYKPTNAFLFPGQVRFVNSYNLFTFIV